MAISRSYKDVPGKDRARGGSCGTRRTRAAGRKLRRRPVRELEGRSGHQHVLHGSRTIRDQGSPDEEGLPAERPRIAGPSATSRKAGPGLHHQRELHEGRALLSRHDTVLLPGRGWCSALGRQVYVAMVLSEERDSGIADE
eukprot:scaffold938_cov334-Pavlova_lutheri.AAC.37